MSKIFSTNILEWVKKHVYTKDETDEKLSFKAGLDTASDDKDGLLSSDDKYKLDNIEAEANNTIVDDELSFESTNSVQNKIITTGLSLKSDIEHEHEEYYNKEEIDESLAEKSDITHEHDDRYYTILEVDDLLQQEEGKKHTHDDRYYTEDEIDEKLSLKSSIGHRHDNATINNDGFFSKEDKIKLDNIEEEATNIIVDSELNNLSINPVENKAVTNTLSGKSDVGHNHDDMYYTKDELVLELSGKSDVGHDHDDRYYSKETLDNRFDSLVGFTASVVNELPAEGQSGVMYLVPTESASEENIYKEYIWTGDDFELIGNTGVSVDLSEYATKTELNTKANNTLANISTDGLMSSVDKVKLDGISDGANKTVVDDELSATSTNPVQNQAIYSEFNDYVSTSLHNSDMSELGYGLSQLTTELYNKADKTVASISTDGLMSANDKILTEALSCAFIPFYLQNEEYLVQAVQAKCDYFVDAENGNDENNGTSISSPVKTISRISDKIQESSEHSKNIYIESGTYTENCSFTTGTSFYGNPTNPPIWKCKTAGYMLNLGCDTLTSEVHIENIIFDCGTTLGTGRACVNITCDAETDTLFKIARCQFKNSKVNYNGGGLHITNVQSNNTKVFVSNCAFINCYTGQFGHCSASCMIESQYGTLRAYNNFFNNPKSANQYYCSNQGSSIGGHSGASTFYGDLKGAYNIFAGEGDTCHHNYTELS